MKKRSFLASRSPHQVLAGGYLTLIAIGTALLSMPAAVRGPGSIGFADALFTAASAACITGLTTLDTGTTFTYFGQFVLLALIQLGGIGFMTMSTWFALVLGKRISLKERLILKESFNQHHTEGIVRLIKKVVMYSLVVEGTAALSFALIWSDDLPTGQALYYGLFHAVSLFNNAGFDLFGGLQPFAHDIAFNAIGIVIILLGGLGFIVLSDLIDWRRTRKLSLHSRIVLTFTGILIVLGTVVIFIFEYTNAATMGPMQDGYKLLASLFQSTSLRSSGTSTVPIDELRQATQFFMIILMFIGAAPGSTGGGIKITTFAVLVAAVYAMIRGRQDVVMFRSRLSGVLVYKAITATVFGLLLVILFTLILSFSEEQPFLTVLFETTSAFGTVGHSMGMTSEMSAFGKTLLVALMVVGRLGPLTLALALQPKQVKQLYRHPEGKIIIG